MDNFGKQNIQGIAIGRRDAIKVAAASVALIGASAWMRGARAADADSKPAVANPVPLAINSRPLMTTRITAAPAQNLGVVADGTRIVVLVTGGDFDGPRLRGRILPGGGDWLLLRPDGVLELDLRITLETDDHALIYMRFQGLRHGPADVIAALARGEAVDPTRYYFRTLPRFETASEKYAFLNRIIAVGEGETRMDGAIHRIDEIL